MTPAIRGSAGAETPGGLDSAATKQREAARGPGGSAPGPPAGPAPARSPPGKLQGPRAAVAPARPHLAPRALVQELAQLPAHRLAQHVQVHAPVGQVRRHLAPPPSFSPPNPTKRVLPAPSARAARAVTWPPVHVTAAPGSTQTRKPESAGARGSPGP